MATQEYNDAHRQCNIMLTAELMDQLQQEVASQWHKTGKRTTVSSLVRAVLKRYLDQQKSKVKFL